jgi:hypothetical protein
MARLWSSGFELNTNTSNADTDFTLSGSVSDLTNYKDAGNVISCRVYQEVTKSFTDGYGRDVTTYKDNYINNTDTNTNYGTNAYIYAGESANSSNYVYRSLLQFDVSSIPSNSTIISATLTLLYKTFDRSLNARTMGVNIIY